MFKKWILVLILFPVLTGCASKQITYTTTGALLGAGGGYAIDRDPKDAAIGGLAGGAAGSVLASIQTNGENKKYKQGYDQGYTQAQLDIAVNDWNTNTGKKDDEVYSKTYHRIRIPQKEVNDVIYESHYQTLEVYK